MGPADDPHGKSPADGPGTPGEGDGEVTLGPSDPAGFLLRVEPPTAADSPPPREDRGGREVGRTVTAPPPADPSAASGQETSDGNAPAAPRERPIPAISGYEILGELGRGGMGIVYRARQVRLNRPCALKMILAGAHSDAEAVVRFLAEAEAVARLQHPNIVQIHHIGEADGLPFFELEYVGGGSLDRRLDGTPWPPRRAASLVEALARGVAEAHRLGIVHRDLKPGNVLLAADGTPKVTDFGLAKSLAGDSGLTRSDSIMGSPGYMAPEQAAGRTRDVSLPADVYALGAILYELLTGRPPFLGASVLETLEQARTAEPVPPSRLVPGLPRDVETVALKCLRKEPEKRYGSAAALAEDLRRFLAGESIQARRTGPPERAWRWCRRKPVQAGLVAALAASLLAGFAGVAWQWRRAEAKADEARVKARLAEAESTRADAAARRAVDEADRARFQTALTSFHQGWSRAEQGDVAEGMLWMAEALERAPEARPEFRSLLRANLPAWEEQLVRAGPVISYEEGVSLFSFSPDGKTALTRLPDKVSLQSRDAANGRPIGRPMTHEGLTSAVFSPDGRKVLSGGEDHTARLWDAATGQPAGAPMRHQHIVASVAFSPDGRKALTASHDKTARLWDAETGRPLGPPMAHQGPVFVARFSPDGNVIVTGSLGLDAQRWDAGTGQPIGPPMRHRWAVYAVAFSPDGTLLLTGSGRDEGAAQLWDAATGQPLGPPVPHNKGIVHQVAFSPDGTVGLSIGGDDQRLRLWDIATGQLLGSPVRLLGSYPFFHPDGRSLVVKDDDREVSRILTPGAVAPPPRSSDRDAGIRSPRAADPAPTPRRYAYAAFSPDGTRVATHGVPRGRLWDAATGQPVGAAFPQRWAGAGPVAFSPDGTRLALVSNNLEAGTWDCTVQLVDARRGRLLAPPIHPIDTVKALAFSPDGSRLATGDFSDGVQLWDATTGAPVGPRLPQANLVLALAFSPDGTRLAVGTTNDRGKDNSQVRLWDLTTRQPTGEPMRHRESVNHVAFSPDGRTLLSVSYDGLAWRWDARTTRPLGPPIPHPTGFHGAVFRADGRAVLTGTRGGVARLWDVRTGQPLSPPANRPSTLTALALRPDGAAFAASYADGMTRLWDLATARPIGPPLTHRGPVLAVAFAPDGRTLLSVDNSADLRTWTVPDPATGPSSGLKLRVQALTGMELQPDQAVMPLDREVWREQLNQLSDRPGRARSVQGEAEALGWYEARARAAEDSGASFAALWHLDRLIASRPDDGTLRVRRALAQAAAGRLDAAEEDLARARKLGPLDPYVDLLAHRADAAMARERWDLALWALHHAVAARPGDWWLYVDRAEALDHLGRKSERDQDRLRAIEHGADSLYLARAAAEAERAGDRARAEALRDLAIERLEARPSCHLLLDLAADQVRRNRLEKAGDLLDRIVKRVEATRPDHLDAGLLWLHLGVPRLYRASCARSLASSGDAPSPATAHALAWQSVLGPDAVADPGAVVRLAEAALAGAPAEQRPRALTTLGAALHRAGRSAEAVGRLEEGIRLGGGQGLPQDWAFLAMAHHALGHSEAAGRWLRKLAGRLPATYWEGVELKLLQSEAEALIQGSRPAPPSPAASAPTTKAADDPGAKPG